MEVTFQGNPLTVEGKQLQVGDKAPDFSSVKTDLSPWSLSEVSGVKILSVVPSLDTSVCQIQSKKFSTEAKDLNGATVITISLDLPFAQARLAAQEGIDNMIIVSDYQNREFALKYNLLIKELKLLSRSVFVLDKDNTVKYVEYLKEITDQPDYDKAVAAAKALV